MKQKSESGDDSFGLVYFVCVGVFIILCCLEDAFHVETEREFGCLGQRADDRHLVPDSYDIGNNRAGTRLLEDDQATDKEADSKRRYALSETCALVPSQGQEPAVFGSQVTRAER